MAADTIVQQQQVDGSVAKAQAGKYLTFRLGNEDYGLEVMKVQEIIKVLPTIRLPKMPASVRGIINLRGKLIPVINVRNKFGLPEVEDSARTCIIIVQIQARGEQLTLGMVVDAVSEVLNVQKEQIEPPPSLGSGADVEFIQGVSKASNKVVILLDIDKVLTKAEASQVLVSVNSKQ